MLGYKAFHPDWTCYNNFKYEVGQTYEMNEEPIICGRGFHFCKELEKCFNYYNFCIDTKVAEVEALGTIISDEPKEKYCTNKIKILREIDWHEVLTTFNTNDTNYGKYNTGYHNALNNNSGHYNYGYGNTDDYNLGSHNSGSHNQGSRNTGCFNEGHCNSGYYNIGYRNTGDHNIGDYNSGDWNYGNGNTGVFNTQEQTIMMFNKPTDLTLQEWHHSKAFFILDKMPTADRIQWVEGSTDDASKITGGSLCYIGAENQQQERQEWWQRLREEYKGIILSMPNFDAHIFEYITGIDVNKKEN